MYDVFSINTSEDKRKRALVIGKKVVGYSDKVKRRLAYSVGSSELKLIRWCNHDLSVRSIAHPLMTREDTGKF